MVSGSHLNTLTGVGMDMTAARQTATGIRHLQRDHDFSRTGFNTQDTMNIMQGAGQAGLLTGAQSPDQLVKKVKDVSKYVKAITQLTGDPDVQNAIQALGQMRELGFNTLGGQTGAIANRATFARQAGMSQAQMGQMQMMGAGMAGQFGLAGATGYGIMGAAAASANIAASSGALDPLQMARAGGKEGLAATQAKLGLSLMSDDMMLLAGSRVGKGGKLEADVEGFRRAAAMTTGDRAKYAAEKLQELKVKGILDFDTQKNEMKDVLAQKLKPGENFMLALRRAEGHQAMFRPGEMGLAKALQETSNGAVGADDSRTVEAMVTKREFWEGRIQQLKAQERELSDQDKARREQYRTPGYMTNVGRGIRGVGQDISDAMSSPYRAFSNRMERVREDDEAAEHGERINRYSEVDLIRTDADRKYLRRAEQYGIGDGERGSNFLDDPSGAGGRMGNRIAGLVGLSSQSNENRISSAASRTRGTLFGMHPLGSFGNEQEDRARLTDAAELGRAAYTGAEMTGTQLTGMQTRISSVSAGNKIDAGAILRETGRRVVARARDLSAGAVGSADALSATDVKREFFTTMKNTGASNVEIQKAWDRDKGGIMGYATEAAAATGDKKVMETVALAQNAAQDLGAIDFSRDTDALQKEVSKHLEMIGLGDASDEKLATLKGLTDKYDDETLGLVAAIAADDERALAEYQAKGMSGDQFRAATGIAKGLSDKERSLVKDLAKGAAGAVGLEKTFDIGRIGIGGRQKIAAGTELIAKLGEYSEGAKDAKTIDAALQQIGAEELAAMPEAMRKQVEAAKGQGPEAVAAKRKLVEDAGPRTLKTRHGGATGALARNAAMISETEEARDRHAGGAGDAGGAADSPAKVVEKASTVVDAMAEVVDKWGKMVGADGDDKAKINLVMNNPILASIFGG
jgi:hypothetical protein